MDADAERYRLILDSIDEGFCVVCLRFDTSGSATDYRFIEVNRAFAQQTGLGDATGKWMRELAPDHEQYWFDAYGRVATTGCPERFQRQAVALGRWFDVCAFRVGSPHEHLVGILFRDMTSLRRSQEALEETVAARDRAIEELADALRRVNTLSGLLPICMYCKSVRDDAGYWERLETYLSNHTGALVSHGLCPACAKSHYTEG